MSENYAGWANVETWAMHLWISNDEGLQAMAYELAAEFRAANAGDIEAAAYELADGLREWAGNVFTPTGYEFTFGGPWPSALANIASEIGSLWRVDYLEIADVLLMDTAVIA